MAAPCALAAFTLQHRHCVVLDARLALGTMGLQLAMALTRAANVWLAREFISLVSQPSDDAPPPALSTLDDHDSEPADHLYEGIAIWQAAFANGIVHRAFHWIGDNALESSDPQLVDPSLVKRFDALTASLEPNYDLGWSPLVTCGLQSLALAASLALEMPIVLTAAGRKDTVPAMCLDAGKAGIASARLPKSAGFDETFHEPLRSAFALAGLMNTPIAGIWLAAPRAGLLGDPDRIGEFVPEPFRLTLPELRPWADAKAFWTRLN